MTDHELVWEYDRNRVEVKAVCNAGPEANCKLVSECECEAWNIERDEKGPFHLVPIEDDDGREVEVRHDMHPSKHGECNVLDWLNNSDCLEEMGRGQFEIGRTPINPIWVGPGFDWEKADE